MPRLTWNGFGERFFEAGVDQGVLFVGNGAGVPWSGLISVSESPRGGDPRPYYQDGIKYQNLATSEEFEATLSAFGSPSEFGVCDGTLELHQGLFATQQPRKSFGLSYRTLVGNDVNGKNHGYKIHLVYNALAGPSQRDHNSLGKDDEPSTYTWDITTLPPTMSGLKPTAHFVIDSRYADPSKLATAEDIIYGSSAAESRMPGVAELISIFA